MSAKFKPWLVLAAIFLAGIATGCALTMALGPRPHGPHGPGDMRGGFMAALNLRLHLTDDQRRKIEPIIADAAHKLEALHRNEIEQGAQIFRDVDDKMDGILTPEQKAELKKMRSERERMFSGHMGPWRHDGPVRRFDDRGGANGPGDMPPPPPPGEPRDNSPNGPPVPLTISKENSVVAGARRARGRSGALLSDTLDGENPLHGEPWRPLQNRVRA